MSRRPYLMIYFRCCRVYLRIYLDAAGTAFVGHCPRCCRRVEVRLDPSGTDQRFFVAE